MANLMAPTTDQRVSEIALNCTRFDRTAALAGGPRDKPRHTPMSDAFSKVEVITGVARRRRFTTEQKLAVVAETMQAARGRIRISTGFNSTKTIKRIFDAYREEAEAAGYRASPEYFALRRRVTVGPTSAEARLYAQAVADRLKSFMAEDERVNANVPDAPAPPGGFTLSDDEFITGTPKDVAENIFEQCRAVGAGHFLTVLNWSAPVDEVAQAHELFGREAIPLLRKAS